MSLPTKWVETRAPVADVYERVVLFALAGRADSDGTNAWPSQETMADSALCDTETVKRRLRAMQRRGLIARGDQRMVAHIRKDRRPVVYDLLIPRSWFSDEQWDELQQERTRKGLAPIDPGSRPDIAPAAQRGRKTRSDKGQSNSKRSTKKRAVSSENHPADALIEPPQNEDHGGSISRGTGALTVVDGGSKRATTSFPDLPQGPPPPDSQVVSKGGQEEEGISTEKSTETAAALLRRWARFRPGKFLGQQARIECERLIDERLAAGWDRDKLGRYIQEWAAQAQNPSTWLPLQLRELQDPKSGPTSRGESAGNIPSTTTPEAAPSPASSETRKAVMAVYGTAPDSRQQRHHGTRRQSAEPTGSAFDDFLAWTGQQMRQDAEKQA